MPLTHKCSSSFDLCTTTLSDYHTVLCTASTTAQSSTTNRSWAAQTAHSINYIHLRGKHSSHPLLLFSLSLSYSLSNYNSSLITSAVPTITELVSNSAVVGVVVEFTDSPTCSAPGVCEREERPWSLLSMYHPLLDHLSSLSMLFSKYLFLLLHVIFYCLFSPLPQCSRYSIQ